MAATAGGAKLKSDAILSLIEERVKKVNVGRPTVMFCTSLNMRACVGGK